MPCHWPGPPGTLTETVSTSHSPWLPSPLSNLQLQPPKFKHYLQDNYLSVSPFPIPLPIKQLLLQSPFLPGPQSENVRTFLDFPSKPWCSSHNSLPPYLLANPFLHCPPKYGAPPALWFLSSYETPPLFTEPRMILLVRYLCASQFTNGLCCPESNSLNIQHLERPT